MHNYLLSFLWSNNFDNTSQYASIYVAVEKNYITEKDIRTASARNNVPLSAVVLAVSYLGEYE